MMKKNELLQLIRNTPKLFIVAVLCLFQFSGFGQESFAFSITPASVSGTPGSTVNVSVRVDSVAPGITIATEFHLDFDNTKLTVVSAGPSAGLPFSLIALPSGTVADMNTSGHIHYAIFDITNTGTSSSFNMFDIEFAINPGAAVGPTPLAFSVTPPHETLASYAGFTVSTPTPTDGVININAASCTLPTAVITASTSCSPALTLQSATGVGPWDLTVNGTTYAGVTVGSTFATVSSPSENLFGNLAPVNDLNNDGEGDGSISVGTRFRSAQDGKISGIRFWRQLDAGTYTGKLYRADGTLLEQAVFSFPNSDAGWFDVNFATAVPITANTDYVAVVHSSLGFYSNYPGYFAISRSNGANLTAPESDGVINNGVFTYSNTFPTTTFGEANYMVDVNFTPSTFNINLTSVTDQSPCTNTGALQTIAVTSSCTLPVSLINFSASSQNNSNIRLTWSTASEQNNKGFEILRSLTGQGNWESIAFINGAGESNSKKDYAYLDKNLSARRYYYQLRQVDFDGASKLSSVVFATLNGKDAFALEQNFPNPFKGQETNIRFTLPYRAQAQLIVYDMSGRVVKTLVNGVKDAGTYVVPFQDQSLPAGVYFYKLTADGFSDVKKMTIR